jgi:hypothetical protein
VAEAQDTHAHEIAADALVAIPAKGKRHSMVISMPPAAADSSTPTLTPCR